MTASLACAIQFDGEADRPLAEQVRSELTELGVRVPQSPELEVPALCVQRTPGEWCGRSAVELACQGRRVLVIGEHPAPGELVWSWLAGGVADVLRWLPGTRVAESVVARLERWQRVDQLLDTPAVHGQLIGTSPAWLAVLRRVVEAGHFTGSTLLLVGESGTGKELAARLVHHLDRRPAKGDLIVLDCTTIVPTLSGSEFFGHERGAFTGAVSARDGAFAAADGGTLFLDEVGELPLALQAELLRVIQEGSYKRVGGDSWRRTRFRLICATNRDLAAEVGAGRFRLDLYHRIAATVLRLPPLRERQIDVLPLFHHFLTETVGGEFELDPVVAEVLRARDYPGNVRDLRQLADRIAARHVGPGGVSPGDLPDEDRPRAAGPGASATLLRTAVEAMLAGGYGYREIRDAAGDTAMRSAMIEAKGNVSAAARLLGVTPRTLQLRKAELRNGHPR